MGTKDDLITKHHEDQIDRNLTDKYRALNLWAEIGSMKKSDPDEDRLNTISGRLMRAEGMFEDVFKNKFTYAIRYNALYDGRISIQKKHCYRRQTLLFIGYLPLNVCLAKTHEGKTK